MKRIALILAVSLAGAACTTMDAQTTQTAANASDTAATVENGASDVTEKQASKPRVICKRLPEPGTRLGGMKICKTSEQWDADRAAARQAVGDIQNH